MNFLKAIKYQVWAIAWTFVIIILCNIQMPQTAGGGFFFDGFDKLVHLGFFYVLTILLFYGKIRFQHNYNFRSLTIVKILIVTAIIGGGIELLQWKFFTWRTAEWWDFICDMLGVSMGIFSYIFLHLANYRKK